MKVLVFRDILSKAKLEEVKNDVKPIQELVGGYFEVHPFYINKELYYIVCDEEGRLKNKSVTRFCRGIPYDYFVGTFFVCKTEGSEFVGLTEEEAAAVNNFFVSMSLDEVTAVCREFVLGTPSDE